MKLKECQNCGNKTKEDKCPHCKTGQYLIEKKGKINETITKCSL